MEKKNMIIERVVHEMLYIKQMAQCPEPSVIATWQMVAKPEGKDCSGFSKTSPSSADNNSSLSLPPHCIANAHTFS